MLSSTARGLRKTFRFIYSSCHLLQKLLFFFWEKPEILLPTRYFLLVKLFIYLYTTLLNDFFLTDFVKHNMAANQALVVGFTISYSHYLMNVRSTCGLWRCHAKRIWQYIRLVNVFSITVQTLQGGYRRCHQWSPRCLQRWGSRRASADGTEADLGEQTYC